MSHPEGTGARHRLPGSPEASVAGSWLRTMLIGHPAIGYVLAVLFPIIGALIGLFLLFWRETRRGIMVLTLCVASTLLVVIATRSDGGDSASRTHAFGPAKEASPIPQPTGGFEQVCTYDYRTQKDLYHCVMRQIESP
jgi:hypothetical protein